jgi:hypothetical protein
MVRIERSDALLPKVGNREEHRVETNERRKYNRFKARDDALVMIPTGSEPSYGFLVDISTDGISFEYFPVDDLIGDAGKLNIILDESGRRFNNLRFKNISDIEISEPHYSPVIMRRRGVQFVGLTTEQQSNLENFIIVSILETVHTRQ